MTVAERLTAEARDYRTRAIGLADQGDDDGARAFRIVAVVLNETAEAIDDVLEEES